MLARGGTAGSKKFDREEQCATLPDMPRKKSSENTAAINLKVPPAWVEMADEIAAAESGLVRPTRTDIMRAALGQGLEALAKKRQKKTRKQG